MIGPAALPPPLLRAEDPGPFSLVQDLGRPGRRAFGVTPSGAMDRFALAAANLLVGNPEGAAGLECALAGPARSRPIGPNINEPKAS